jgi:molybdopterin converting factor small subunit
MALVRIPTPLRSFTRQQSEVRVPGATVGEVLRNLDTRHPGIGARLFDGRGGLRRYVNVFHNDEDIRGLRELETPIADSDTLSIIAAMAGG